MTPRPDSTKLEGSGTDVGPRTEPITVPPDPSKEVSWKGCNIVGLEVLMNENISLVAGAMSVDALVEKNEIVGSPKV